MYFSIIKKIINRERYSVYNNQLNVLYYITVYNKFIGKITKNVFTSIIFETIKLDFIKKTNKIILTKTIPNFIFAKNILNITDINEVCPNETKRNNINLYPVNGLLCFICYHRTKTTKKINIYVISNQIESNTYDAYDITQLVEINSFILMSELKNIINYHFNMNEEFLETMKTIAGEKCKTFSTNEFYCGYLASINIKKNASNNCDILNYLYNHDKVNISELYMDLYLKIFQYKNKSKKFIFNECDSYVSNKFVNIIKPIKYNNLMQTNNYSDFSFIYIYENDLYHYLMNTDQYIIAGLNKIKNNNIDKAIYGKIDEYIKVKLINITTSNLENIKTKKVNISAREILFSNYGNKIYEENYGPKTLNLFKSKRVFIPHQLLNKDDFLDNTLFKILEKNYVIKNNNIVIKKNINNLNINNKLLLLLIKINNDEINWHYYINFLDSNNLSANNADNIKNSLKLFMKSNHEEAKKITKTFSYMSLTKIFNFIFENDQQQKIFLNDFIKEYKNMNLIIKENQFVSKNNSINIINENNKYFIILEIISIILFFFIQNS